MLIAPIFLAAALPARAGFFDRPRRVEVYESAAGGPRLALSTTPVSFEPWDDPTEHDAAVFVDPSKKFQTLIGIGGALTDAAADTFAALPPARQDEVIKAFYDPKEGLGYTLARTNINSCDFSSATYTYAADGDASLASFSIAHDLQNRIPLIKRAMKAAGGRLKLFASPWSPPAWMKDNHDMLDGGRLKPEFADAWARYFVAFIRAYEKAGVPVWGLTVQNEPTQKIFWESCQYTAAQERDFLRDHLGPALAAAGLSRVKVIVWDQNRDMLLQRLSVLLGDPAAARYVWGVGFHWYEYYVGGTPLYDNVRRAVEAFPDKTFLLTEATLFPFDAVRLDDWSLGETYGRSMIRDFNNGAAAWTDWNVLLDERGGPNHVGNFCFAALHADTKTGALHYTSIYDYIGHFSKFIRPGARRVALASSRDWLLATAFLNKDGSLAVVVMNDGKDPAVYRLWLAGRAAAFTAAPRSIATIVLR